MDRKSIGALKVRLRNDPADAAARSEIVRVYRLLGHLDQAGRFAIGLDEGPRPDELYAYAGMVRGLGADEERVRRLSLLSADRELPGKVRQAIEAGPPVDDWRPWGVVVGIAWGAVAATGLATLIVVYGFTMAGADDARSVARTWTLISGWGQALTLALTTLWCASSSKRRAAAVWACITAAFSTVVLLVSVMFAG